MKNIYFSFGLFLVTSLMCAQYTDIFLGKWKGEFKTSSYDCLYSEVSITFEKDSKGRYFGEFTASQTGKKYFNKRFTIRLFNGYFENGNLIFEAKNDDTQALFGDSKCPMRFELNYSLNGDVAHLRGRFENKPCKDFGELWIIRDMSKKEISFYEHALLDVQNVKITDENNNGKLENGEAACFSFDVSNKMHFQRDEFILLFGQTIDVYSAGIPDLKETPNDRVTLSFLVTSKRGDALTDLPYFLSVKRNGTYQTINKGTVTVSPDKVQRAVPNDKFAVKDIEGFWIGDYGAGLYSFKNDGTVKFNNGKMYSGFNHFVDPCSGGEGISLTKSQMFAVRSELPPTMTYRFVEHDRPDNGFFRAVASLYGNSYDLVLYRVEQPLPPENVLAELEQLVAGKWYFESAPNSLFNFKPNHESVQHNPINGADFGTWFWTVGKENGKSEYYLWNVAGKVFGTSKYRVDFQQSAANRLVLYNRLGKQSVILKDDSIDVPENYVGRIGTAPSLVSILVNLDEKETGLKLFGPIISADAKAQNKSGQAFYDGLMKKL